MKFTGLTADSSAVIVDTSKGLKQTELLFIENLENQPLEDHVELRDASRVQKALLAQRKQ